MPDDRFLYHWQDLGAPPQKRTRWASWQWDTCPTLSGIYAIYEHGRLVYIGSARALRTRLRQHLRHHYQVRDVVKIKVVVVADAWRSRERRLIERLKPRDNRQWAIRRGAGEPREGYW